MSSPRKTVPIGASMASDAYYRYQMEAVRCQARRRKTCIVNMERISKDLNRSSLEVIKYLGQAMNSTGSYSSKSKEYLLNGTHSEEAIQVKIQDYCETFVMCGICKNPETEYKVKNETIFLKCAACGSKTCVDDDERLCKHIITQHKLSNQAKKNKSDKDKEHTKKKKGRMHMSVKEETSEASVKKDAKRKTRKKKNAQADSSIPKQGDYEEAFENPYFSTKGNPLYIGNFDRIAKAAEFEEGAAIDLAVRKVKSFLTKNQEASTEDIVSAVASAQESLKVLFSSDQILIFVKAVLVSPLVEVCESIEKHKDALSLVMKSFSDDEQFLIDALKEEVQNEQEASAIVALLHDLDIIQKEPSLDD